MLTCIVNQQEGAKDIPGLPQKLSILNPIKQNSAVSWIHFCNCQIAFPKAMLICNFFCFNPEKQFYLSYPHRPYQCENRTSLS